MLVIMKIDINPSIQGTEPPDQAAFVICINPHRSALLMTRTAPFVPGAAGSAHLVVNRLPVLPQRSPAAHAGRFLVQVDSDVLFQLLVDLLESSHLLDVLHQAAVQALVGEPSALLQPRGQGQGSGGAAQTLQEDAADTQGSAGHSGAQAAYAASGDGAHVDAGGSRQAPSAPDADPAAGWRGAVGRGGGGLLPQEGGPAPRQGHGCGCRPPSAAAQPSPALPGAMCRAQQLGARPGLLLCATAFWNGGFVLPGTLSRRPLGQQSHCRGNLRAAAAANVAAEKHNGVYSTAGQGIQHHLRVKMPAALSALAPGWVPALRAAGFSAYMTNALPQSIPLQGGT